MSTQRSGWIIVRAANKSLVAVVELEVYSDEEQDLEEGGYQKKKVKTAESWAAKKASDAASVAASLAASKN